ncbi:MAG TPA: Txe/YoeB family addiction module toxin [Candidatus Saccharimonadales bacterium]|nr:Txe/YoeB family addiction module toxin [Candidatus Saccharimonadales bacterium]
MSRKLIFTPEAWEDYLYWQTHDKQLLKKINQLLKDCQRHPMSGIGKPEALRGDLSGTWSRRMNDEHRLVYLVDENAICVIACRYHY